MPNNETKLPEKSNSIYTKKWIDTFHLFLTLAKTLVIGASLILLYIIFGDNFDFQKIARQRASSGSSQPTMVDADWDKVENGIHVSSGLIYAANFDVVRGNCTACHSGKLIAQNRATREGWEQMIRWMQETQGLWDLGKNEPKILDYLATHYAPEEVGRRANIDVTAIEWYILDLDKGDSTK